MSTRQKGFTLNATVTDPIKLDDAPDTYRVTVTGFDIRSHRRLACAAFRSFARNNKIGRASLVSAYGNHENDHGISQFNFRVTGK
jgi:hypothetical protein